MTIIEKLKQIYGDKVNQYATDIDNFETYVDLPKEHLEPILTVYEDKTKEKLGRVLVEIPALISDSGICYVTFEDAQVIEHFKIMCEWNEPTITKKKVVDFDTLYVDYYHDIEKTIESDEVETTDTIHFDNIYQIGDKCFGDVIHYIGNNRGCLYDVPLESDKPSQKVTKEMMGIITYFKQSLRYHAIELKKTHDYNVAYNTLKQHMKTES